MSAGWIEKLTGSLEQKKQYRQHRARIEALPAPYRNAAKAVERYLMYSGSILEGDLLVTMLGDLAELWEQAAADGATMRTIVGDDPVAFAETFARAYPGRQWIDKERARLVAAIENAERGPRADGGER